MDNHDLHPINNLKRSSRIKYTIILVIIFAGVGYFLLDSLFMSIEDYRLIQAARNGQLEVVKNQLSKGANINAKVFKDTDHPTGRYLEGESALFAAVSKNHLKIAKYLLKQGADPNIGKASTYPLYAATNLQNFEMMDLLIKYGANINQHEFILLGAIRSGNIDIVERTIKLTNNVNKKLKNLSISIFRESHELDHEMIELLVKLGADVNAADDFGRTPIMITINSPYGGFRNVKQLIDLGANVNVKDSDGYSTLLMAAKASSPDSQRIFELVLETLINSGGSVDDKVLNWAYSGDTLKSNRLRMYHHKRAPMILAAYKASPDYTWRELKRKTPGFLKGAFNLFLQVHGM